MEASGFNYSAAAILQQDTTDIFSKVTGYIDSSTNDIISKIEAGYGGEAASALVESIRVNGRVISVALNDTLKKLTTKFEEANTAYSSTESNLSNMSKNIKNQAVDVAGKYFNNSNN